MAKLNVHDLAVTSFTTTDAEIGTSVPYSQDGNCISPLCVTEDKACTTPWCEPKDAGTVAG